MDNKMCSCGSPQSFPIPHEHDRTEREENIMKCLRMLHLKDLIYFRNELQNWYGSEWQKYDKIFAKKIAELTLLTGVKER